MGPTRATPHAESSAGSGKDAAAPSKSAHKSSKVNSASNRTASRTAGGTKSQSHSAPSSKTESAANANANTDPNTDRSAAPSRQPNGAPATKPDTKPNTNQRFARTHTQVAASAENQAPGSSSNDARTTRGSNSSLAKAAANGPNVRPSAILARHPELDPAGATAAVLGTLLESIEEGVAHVSTEGLILYANKRFAYLIGGEALVIEPNKTHLRDLTSTDCWRDLDQGLKLAAREQVSGTLRIEEPTQHIQVRTVRLILTPVRSKSQITIKVTAKEMTELLQKNRELQEKEDSLHAISARIMQLQDEERRRIARDLHDITGQELAVVIMLLMQASREIRSDTESLKTITDAAGMIRKIEEEIRTLSYVLHPPLLDELGLGPALNWYVEGFTKRSGIDVKLDLQQGLPRLHKDKELSLFRVVQEALTNVMRHSGSRTGQIHLSSNADSVTLAIQDEGKGIGRKRFGKVGPVQGVGIMGMRERLQQLGGEIEVRQLPKGTEVIATMPIGFAPPVENPFSDDDILQMARALGYRENPIQSSVAAQPPPAPAQAATPGQEPRQKRRDQARPGRQKPDQVTSGQERPSPAQSSPAHPNKAETARPSGQQVPPLQPSADSAPAAARKRILIADDHDVTRHGVRSMLQDQDDIEICGEASNALEAILKAKKLGPDLIIMDLSMPGGGGFSAANKIRQARMHAKILLFTTHQSPEIERMARIAGFEGLVQKTDAARDLVRGIKAVLEGHRFFDAQVLTEEGEITKRRAARTGAA